MASFVLVLLLLSVRFGLNYFFVGRKGLKIGLKSK